MNDELGEMTGTDVLELLQNGDVTVQNIDKPDPVVISITDVDTAEVIDAKRNIEFTVNNIQETISLLKMLLQQTGNPRYAESIATLINAMNNANGQLLNINKDNKEAGKQSAKIINNTQKNITITTTNEAIKNLESIDVDDDKI